MLVVFPKMITENVLVIDVEFDNLDILQVAAMLFSRTNEDVFKLEKTFNDYVKRDKVGYYANKHTGLTVEFLNEYGLSFEDFRSKLNEFLNDLDLDKTIFVSHGTNGDRKVLRNAKINLPAHSMCTYKLTKNILGDSVGHRLQDVAAESGFSGGNFHDALTDTMATVSVLSFLLNKKNER